MGKKDYTKYSNKNENHKKTEEIQNGFVEAPVVEEPVVEEPIEEVVEETIVEEPVVEEKTSELKPAYVYNCTRLNVRSEASLESEVVCIIDPSTQIMVDEEASIEEFYKVYVETGAEGFCLKMFIKLKS